MAPQSKREADEEAADTKPAKKIAQVKELISDGIESLKKPSETAKDTQDKSDPEQVSNNNHATTNDKNSNSIINNNDNSADNQKNGSADHGDKKDVVVAAAEAEPKKDEKPADNKTDKAAEEKKPVTGNQAKTTNKSNESESQAKTEEAEPEPEGEPDEGTLLICGGANWDMTGRKELPKTAKKPTKPDPAARNLWGPHRAIHNGKNIRVKGIFGGCNACHSVIVTDEGDVMTFGRNDRGQLGLGDTETRTTPNVVEPFKDIDIVAAACGRSHTLFLSSEGMVFACGDNKFGQCGTNQQAVQFISTPTRIAFKENKRVVKMACGADFSMIVDEDGRLYSFGHPEHGQLGHNSEGKYFTSGNKYAFHCEYQPRRIIAFVEKSREGHVTPVEGEVKIVDIACGTNHTLAVDTRHRCFAWGFAGYHRLGHQETKNEMVPRSLRLFDVPPSAQRGAVRVFAGASFSMAIDQSGLLYFWGQNKSSGEATMYPKTVQDLCGWRIRSVACGNRSIFVAAEESCISWGPSPTYGELGYGEGRSKSSTTPNEVRTLDGVYAVEVACGFGHTLIKARDGKPEEKALLEKNFPTWP